MSHSKLTNNEIKLNHKRYIISKNWCKKIIEYGNDYFVAVPGYTEAEPIVKPHSIERHPDMKYDESINDILGNKGIFKLFFTAMKKLFS